MSLKSAAFASGIFLKNFWKRLFTITRIGSIIEKVDVSAKIMREINELGEFVMNRKSFVAGALLALIPGVLWGLSGVFGQYLFQQRELSAEWLTTVRLLISGSLMLIISFTWSKEKTLAIFQNRRDTMRLFIFAVFGLMAVQLTYFVSIAKSNAPTATILQYLFPVLIVLFTSVVRPQAAAEKRSGCHCYGGGWNFSIGDAWQSRHLDHHSRGAYLGAGFGGGNGFLYDVSGQSATALGFTGGCGLGNAIWRHCH